MQIEDDASLAYFYGNHLDFGFSQHVAITQEDNPVVCGSIQYLLKHQDSPSVALNSKTRLYKIATTEKIRQQTRQLYRHTCTN